MRRLALLVSLLIMSLLATNAQEQVKESMILESANDTTEYELLIFDNGFESFLASQKPMSYHSDNYYRSWNLRYVSEWNTLYMTQNSKHPEIENRIDYNPSTDYGVELNYKLYWYFIYFEKENGITLVKRGKL